MGLSAIFLFCVLCASSALNADSKNLPALYDNETENYVFQKYVELDKQLKEIVNYGLKKALPYIMEGSQHVSLSKSCTTDIFKLISDIRNLKLSAFKILDAIGKIPEGYLTGNIFVLGDYDQCMSTTVTRKDGNVAFKGQYCMISFKPLLPSHPEKINIHRGIQGLKEATKNSSEVMQFLASILHYYYHYSSKLGICVPSGCSSEDIDSMAKYISGKIIINATVAYCNQHYENPITTGNVVAIFFFSLFGLLCIIGSAIDYYAKKRDITLQNGIARLLQCFSVLTNFPKVISAKITEKSLSCLFGIRTLSLFYVILLHHYFFNEKFHVQGHLIYYQDKITTFFMQIVVNGFLTTEVFFFVGGLVNSYSSMKYMDNGKRKISCIAVIVHRLFRIYPPYVFIILCVYIVGNTHGPLRTLVHQAYWDNCDTNWWQNLLFINNFYMQEKTCLFHGWYIAADMHLFLISVFTVPVFVKNPKKGILLHLGILVAGLVSTALWAWHKNILPALIISQVSQEEINRVWNAYTTTFPHIAPYFAGLLIGYFISAYKNFKIPLCYRLIGWTVATIAFLSMLFMTQLWMTGEDATVLESVLYFSFSRLIYVLAVGWLIVCCAKGYGGIINYILSLKLWIPISRLSYMMFLISPIIQTSYIANLRMIADSNDMILIWRYFGDLLASFIVALALALLVESPFIGMEKIIFRRKSTEGTKKAESCNEAQVNCVNEEKGQRAIELENNNKNTTQDLPLKI